jgi:hypothetical protein
MRTYCLNPLVGRSCLNNILKVHSYLQEGTPHMHYRLSHVMVNGRNSV